MKDQFAWDISRKLAGLADNIESLRNDMIS
jgi:hypothetical protein